MRETSLNPFERMRLHRETCHFIKLLLGDVETNSKQLFYGLDFSGFNFYIFEDHLDFLSTINETIEEIPGLFDADIIQRWKLLNETIILGYTYSKQDESLINQESINLAGYIAFPLLEELARRVSNAWDKNGKLLIDIPESYGLLRKTSRGKIEKKTYKKGHLIVSLAHKLEVMKLSFDHGLQHVINSLDQRMQIIPIEGINQKYDCLFNNLEKQRNKLLHGRQFDNWVAIFISLFMMMIYIKPPSLLELLECGHKRFKIPPAHRLTLDPKILEGLSRKYN
jgi:hypothetical protein